MNSGIIYGTTFLREDRTYKDRKLMISDADRKRLEKHLFERIESMLQQEYPDMPPREEKFDPYRDPYLSLYNR